MQACYGSHQISGLVPLRKLVQPGSWYAAAAAVQLCRQEQWQQTPRQLCRPLAVSSQVQATLTADTAQAKPLFSSRAKIAEACVPWLKGSKNRY